MIVMLFGHPVTGVAENERSIPNVFRVVDGDRGCGAVAKHMRIETVSELPSRALEDRLPKGPILELGPDFRNPDRVEFRMDRRGVRIAVSLLASHQDRPMHVEVPFESRRERRWENCLVRDVGLGLLGREDDLPVAAELYEMPAESHHREVL